METLSAGAVIYLQPLSVRQDPLPPFQNADEGNLTESPPLWVIGVLSVYFK